MPYVDTVVLIFCICFTHSQYKVHTLLHTLYLTGTSKFHITRLQYVEVLGAMGALSSTVLSRWHENFIELQHVLKINLYQEPLGTKNNFEDEGVLGLQHNFLRLLIVGGTMEYCCI